jgi:hypothetical protein
MSRSFKKRDKYARTANKHEKRQIVKMKLKNIEKAKEDNN